MARVSGASHLGRNTPQPATARPEIAGSVRPRLVHEGWKGSQRINPARLVILKIPHNVFWYTGFGAACARRRGRRSWTASPGRPRRGWITSSGARENKWSTGLKKQGRTLILFEYHLVQDGYTSVGEVRSGDVLGDWLVQYHPSRSLEDRRRTQIAANAEFYGDIQHWELQPLGPSSKCYFSDTTAKIVSVRKEESSDSSDSDSDEKMVNLSRRRGLLPATTSIKGRYR